MKFKIKLFLTMALLVAMVIVFSTYRVGAEVTSWQPITEIQENKVTFSHDEFRKLSDGKLSNHAILEIRVNDVLFSTQDYIYNSIVEQYYDNSIDNIIEFKLFAYYEGQTSRHQLGFKKVFMKAVPPFNWNWQYESPTCDGFIVNFPEDLPHKSLDVNIKVRNNSNNLEQTFNFRDDDGFNASEVFKLENHELWDSNWKDYTILWTQVHGTNYHWQGEVTCKVEIEELSVKPDAQPSQQIKRDDLGKNGIIKKDNFNEDDDSIVLPNTGSKELMGVMLMSITALMVAVYLHYKNKID